ncbi:unnamed protein product [Urochloa decumbens]|uniref:Uncharacterized protein n=1 Tax=Urochloa decumbens TaxID=240449 RepID=A0ABC8W7U4_9POAL
MAAAGKDNSTGMPPAGGKKPRKPYQITRPREKWAADEHDRFLHGLMLFGRDWKRIEEFVATKTATQIRSHAQKYFLKAQKLGLGAALPPPHPRRGAVLAAHASCGSQSQPEDKAVAGTAAAAAAAQMWPPAATPPPTSSMNLAAPSGGAQQSHSADWARASAGARHWPRRSGGEGEPSGTSSVAGAMPAQEEDQTIQLPLPPGDPRFALVYRFVGDVFGCGVARPVEAQLQKLQGLDPVVADTILLVLRNLQENLFV